MLSVHKNGGSFDELRRAANRVFSSNISCDVFENPKSGMAGNKSPKPQELSAGCDSLFSTSRYLVLFLVHRKYGFFSRLVGSEPVVWSILLLF
jgi:hypothetical protein